MQKYELAKFESSSIHNNLFYIHQHKRNFNKPLHSDYLNNKMKSIRKHHPALAHATPHKLRHTGAALPKQAETSIEAISEALTHSDMITTKTDVNIPMAVGEIAYRCLNNGVNHKVSVNVDIAVLINVLR